METVTNQNLTGIDKLISDAEFNRFSVISVILIVVGCLGGMSVGSGGLSSTWQLIVAVIPTMVTLSFVLAISPMRLLLTTALITTIIHLILITYNLM